jgi:two-component system OmpR family sensor kinase
MSIRARVTLFGVAVVAAIYTVIAVLIYALLSFGFAEDQDRLLASRATAAVDALAELPAADLAPRTPLMSVDAVATGEAVVVVLDG